MHESRINIQTVLFFVMTTMMFIFNMNTNSFLGIPAYIWSNGIIALFVCLTVVQIIYNSGIVAWNTVYTYAVLFCAICFASLFYSYSFSDTLSKLSTILLVVALSICIYNYITGFDVLETTLKAYSWAGFVAVVYLFVNSDISFSSLDTTGRLGNVIGNSNSVGITFAFTGAIAVYLFKAEKGTRKWIYMIHIVFMGIAIMFTGSRSAFILFLISILANLFMQAYKNRWNFIRLGLLVLGVTILMYLLFYVVMNVQFLYNILGIRLLSFWQVINGGESIMNEGSTQTRQEFALRAFNWFLNSPLWMGNGIGAFPSYNATFSDGWKCYSHCDYTEILSGVGILGFVFYYGSYIHFIRVAMKNIRSNVSGELCILLFTLILEFLVGEIFTVSYYEKSSWILFGILAGILNKITSNSNMLENKDFEIDD